MQSLIWYLVWLVVALGAAAVVLVAAGLLTTERFGAGRGVRGVREDVRLAWESLRRRGAAPGETPEALDAVLAEPVETSMDDFFRANVQEGPAYLQGEVITTQLERAADVVRASVPARAVRRAREDEAGTRAS